MTAATGRRVAATAVRAGERFARRLRAHFAWVLLAEADQPATPGNRPEALLVLRAITRTVLGSTRL